MALMDTLTKLAGTIAGVASGPVGTAAQVGLGVYGMTQASRAAKQASGMAEAELAKGGAYRDAVMGELMKIVTGESPRNLPMYRDAYSTLRFSLDEQLRDLDRTGATERERIARTVPSGGAKLRMLAETERNIQQDKAKAVRTYHADLEKMDVQLAQEARGLLAGRDYTSAPAVNYASEQLKTQQQAYGDIAKYLGALTKKEDPGATIKILTGKEPSGAPEYYNPNALAPMTYSARSSLPWEPYGP
uniref:Uncharacterized protein n=1 Tax=viral metagenome TaxID=1070528 RepID=A0A6M3KCN8_9ZZZZ